MIRKYSHNFKGTVGGIDEAGRGSLAGPVVACAIIFQKKSKNCFPLKITDSKKLTPVKREKIYKIVKKLPQVEWGIGKVGAKIIDKINILQATKLAMEKAVLNLTSKLNKKKLKINFLLIDGNFGIDLNIPQKFIIKGDEKIFLIKLASIVAKVSRDKIMLKYHKKYPQYGFDKHKGYPTDFHRKMLKKFGPSKIHRKTFALYCNR